MSKRRRTYAPEVGAAIVARIEALAEANQWGLALLQQGGLEWFYAPEDITQVLPAVLVQVDTSQEGQASLDARPYTYEVRVLMALSMEDSLENPVRLQERLRDLHDEFIKGHGGSAYRLDVDVVEDSWKFQDCQAYAYGPDPGDLLELGIIAGHVLIRVRAEATPYTP